MPLPKKARIQNGFPKLAKTLRDSPTYYFQSKPGGYPNVAYACKPNELIVLIGDSYRSASKHFVPLRLLIEERVPINAILTWKYSYTAFPIISNYELVNDASIKDLFIE